MKKYLRFLRWILGVVMVGIYGIFGGFYGNFGRALMVYAEENLEIKTEGLPEIYIRALNPGYSVEGVSNVGEMIEIGRNSDEMVSLAGITVGYTNSSGSSTIFEFPEYSFLAGESILLRLAGSPESELAAGTYKVAGSSTGLAQGAGPLELKRGEEVLDSVCWTGKDDCYRKFKSGSGESLVRNLETGEFEFKNDYRSEYKEENYYLEEGMGEVTVDEEIVSCRGLEFSEILSYYEDSKAEQFIEIYNNSSNAILLDSCLIRYKNKNYPLSGTLREGGYFAYHPDGFSLTKNPANANKIELIDKAEKIVDTLEYYNGQKKGTSYAFIGYDASGQEIWRTTFAPTPGEANNYQEFRTCEEGKVINEATGNCVKVTTVAEKICGEGQYLNLLTGRCKKIEVASVKVCKEGYILNPETNRCRKIQENTGANYSLTPETYEENSSFVALYAILGVVGVGLVYVIYEFRKEIWKLFCKVFRRAR